MIVGSALARAVGQAARVAVAFGACTVSAFAQSESPTIELTVAAGRPIRVALNNTIRLTEVGQPVTATTVEAVYAYDRIVLPAGSAVSGHVAQLIGASKSARLKAMLGGDFSPPRRVVLDFDRIIVDGQSFSIQTVVTYSAERVRRQTARDEDPSGGAAGAIEQRKRDVLAAIKEPGKLARLKEALLNRLPYHPQYLHQGTVYNLELQSPIAFGSVTPSKYAPAGTSPAPDSILAARLTTPLDSAKTSRGTAVTAVVTEPVFSVDHELVLPEGAEIEGEVTFAKPAQRWHRNGQLRFLFERARLAPNQDSATMLASLYSVDASQDERVALDEEGGASATNSKARFVAPALAVAALRGSHGDHDHDLGTDPATSSGGGGRRGLGGFFGFGLIGVGLSQLSRPVGIALAAVGAAKTVYKNIVGRGHDVSFAADTPIQVRLAPGKTPGK